MDMSVSGSGHQVKNAGSFQTDPEELFRASFVVLFLLQIRLFSLFGTLNLRP